MENSTIAAIATPVAGGGVGVIRISGPRSKEVLFRVFRRFPLAQQIGSKTTNTPLSPKTTRSHRFYHGYIVDNDRLVDEVLMVFMQAPRSYTGEDIVEIHAHGGPVVLKTILHLLVSEGVKLAEPGEFTRRAFLNGKIDLTQAEAVADIIEARSVMALNIAANQVSGKMNREVCFLIEKMAVCLAEIEADIEFSDQTETPVSLKDVRQMLTTEVAAPIQQLIDRHDDLAWIKKGLNIALVGAPMWENPHCLMPILGRERAIVTATPGTTRDFIEESVVLNGLAFVFTDTAGLRSAAGDDVERIGMARTQEVIADADTVVFMVDAEVGVTEEGLKVVESIKHKNMIMVANKIDLLQARSFIFPPEWEESGLAIKISALTGKGLETLKALLVDQHRGRLESEDDTGLIPNLRHKTALEEALKAVLSAITAVENNLTEDVVVIDLRDAIDSMNRILGQNAGMDVLDDIFSRFCVGK